MAKKKKKDSDSKKKKDVSSKKKQENKKKQDSMLFKALENRDKPDEHQKIPMKKELTSLINALESGPSSMQLPKLELKKDDIEEEKKMEAEIIIEQDKIPPKTINEEDEARIKKDTSVMKEKKSVQSIKPVKKSRVTVKVEQKPSEPEIPKPIAPTEPEKPKPITPTEPKKPKPIAPTEPEKPKPAAPVKVDEDPYKPTETLMGDIGVFLQELIDSYGTRYDMWEESTNMVLGVLRKMQMINKENAEILVETIGIEHDKIKKGLDRFKTKRDAVEKYSDANYAEVAGMLKKTLDLLSLQLKEFKIKSLLNQVLEVYQK
ncbi:MAG: hypothetical protein GY870_07705 [archaeon]|nr:hypothetical protein [archaeon]